MKIHAEQKRGAAWNAINISGRSAWAEGDEDLVHRLRGRPGNRRGDPAVREQAIGLYREHHSDFGCVLACENLAERPDRVVDDQTRRRWLIEAKPGRHQARVKTFTLEDLL